MLHYNTVNNLLKESLVKLMAAKEFKNFRLVGGTALSLQIGHRRSIDIDLFSDGTYGSIDFKSLERFLQRSFPYVDYLSIDNPALGMSFTIGNNREDVVKLDVYYTDPFIQPAHVVDNIRMATVEEIIAMKIDVVQRGGRKKDFWDIHELLDKYPINTMLELHERRYEYGHDEKLILENFTDFTIADDDFDPVCLKGKYWEFIKEDIKETIQHYRSNADNK